MQLKRVSKPGADGPRAMVSADVLLVLTVVLFLLVVLAFGWWRAREAEPAPQGSNRPDGQVVFSSRGATAPLVSV